MKVVHPKPTFLEWCLVIALLGAEVYYGMTRIIDYALPWVYYNYGGSIMPYGHLWFLLNPWYWTDLLYRLYLLGAIIFPMFLVQLWFVRTGRLNIKWLIYGQLQNIAWFYLHGFQNITVTAFGPLATIYPALILLDVFQKVPFGWSWNLSDPHWQCAFGGITLYFQYKGHPVGVCDPNKFQFGSAYFVYYVMDFFWFFIPLGVWMLHKGYFNRPKTYLKSYVLKAIKRLKAFWINVKITWANLKGDYYKVPDYPEGPCCEAGEKCDGSCME